LITRRKFLKLCAGSLLALAFADDIYRTASASNTEIPVLLYHRVGYTGSYLTVTPEHFANDLSRLKKNGYNTISIAQFQDFVCGQSISLPEKPILITFDDGYADNFENAYPILVKYGMTAAFFIITGLLWSDGRLSPQNLLEMKQGGMSFGSHTLSHRPLGELSAADAHEELNSSRSTLESILNVPVQSIAYPRGSYTATTVKLAQDTSYSIGFTTISGTCSRNSSVFDLKRIPVFSYDSDIISLINRRRNG